MDIVEMVILCILVIIALLFAVIIIRTILNKSTEALDAKIDYKEDQRALDYGKMLSEMIRCETVSGRYDSDKSKFFHFHKILERLFPNIHKTCEKTELKGSLLFKWKGSGNEEPILLMSHQDVVEATGEWEHEPFSGEIDNEGKLWGRGTVDTKGSLFCLLNAVEELIKEGFTPNGDVYMASSCTEEFSGEGAPLTVEYLKSKGVKLGLLLDEGGMIMEEPIGGVKGTYAMLGVLEKGYGDLKFIAKGSGGHASAPTKNTPIARLAAFIQEVEKHNPFTVKFNDSTIEMFRRLSPNMNFGMKAVFSNLWLFRPLLKKIMPSISAVGAAMIKTTIAFTTAKGSNGLNVLPNEAYVTGNLRFIPHQGTDESIELISNIASKYGIRTEIIYKDYPCPVVDYKREPFGRVEKTIHEIFPGIGVVPYVMTGGTDAKYYKDICRDCIRFAPLYINKQQHESIHGLNENIFIKVLPKGVDFYKQLIKNSTKDS